MLKGKAYSAQRWLPSQVAYGMDCSDPDPEKWHPFGDSVDQQATRGTRPTATAAAKAGQPAQSGPEQQ